MFCILPIQKPNHVSSWSGWQIAFNIRTVLMAVCFKSSDSTFRTFLRNFNCWTWPVTPSVVSLPTCNSSSPTACESVGLLRLTTPEKRPAPKNHDYVLDLLAEHSTTFSHIPVKKYAYVGFCKVLMQHSIFWEFENAQDLWGQNTTFAPGTKQHGVGGFADFFFDAKMTNNAFFQNKKRASSTSVSALNGPDIKMY